MPPKTKNRKTTKVHGRVTTIVDTESEPKEEVSDEEGYVEVALHEGDSGPSEPVDDSI